MPGARPSRMIRARGALVAGAAQRAGRRRRVAAALDASLSLGEALGPLAGGLVWDAWGVVAFFALRPLLGMWAELVLGRRLRPLLRDRGGMEPPRAGIGGRPAGTGPAAGEEEAAMSDPLEKAKGRAKEAAGAITGNGLLERAGEAQRDKAEAEERAEQAERAADAEREQARAAEREQRAH